MNLDELRPILAAYRAQVQPAWSPATAHPGYDGTAGDPAGQCGVTSAWLQRRLREDHGIETLFCFGPVFTGHGCADAHHCWLETAGPRTQSQFAPMVIDLTADQLRGLEARPVICETYDDLVSQDRAYYEARGRFGAAAMDDDPLQPRLAILTEALS